MNSSDPTSMMSDLGEYTQKLADAEQARVAGEWERLDRVAHTIKGNALAAGDNAMAETAIALRKASALKNGAEADSLISRLRELQKEL